MPGEVAAALKALETKLYANVGRWAIGVIIAIIATTAVAVQRWESLQSRLHNLETDAVRQKDIADIKLSIENRLTRIEATQEAILLAVRKP